jgi:hypothetical protein
MLARDGIPDWSSAPLLGVVHPEMGHPLVPWPGAPSCSVTAVVGIPGIGWIGPVARVASKKTGAGSNVVDRYPALEPDLLEASPTPFVNRLTLSALGGDLVEDVRPSPGGSRRGPGASERRLEIEGQQVTAPESSERTTTPSKTGRRRRGRTDELAVGGHDLHPGRRSPGCRSIPELRAVHWHRPPRCAAARRGCGREASGIDPRTTSPCGRRRRP